jgi:hypothetical protein
VTDADSIPALIGFLDYVGGAFTGELTDPIRVRYDPVAGLVAEPTREPATAAVRHEVEAAAVAETVGLADKPRGTSDRRTGWLVRVRVRVRVGAVRWSASLAMRSW